ncbi:hypothetical protein Q5P01_000251 [Channa striata]|uniref:Uncharacterized protein n=1 Tax=Channa striata TaxID=64152 RepID=A0AA88LID3_CHASR|nr:hypothetical protein Q5P01_000251 [Channa striata]
MGLKHRSDSRDARQPDLAPRLDEPLERQDWILIDHLMVIHKVKESDYVESEPATSVNMARTLARNYMPEGPRAARGARGKTARRRRSRAYLDCRELEEDRRYSPRRPLAAVAGRRSSRPGPEHRDGEIRRPRDSPAIRGPPSPSRRARGWRRTRGAEGAGPGRHAAGGAG